MPPAVAIRASRLYPGHGDRLVERPLVLLEGGRIAAVEQGDVDPPPGCALTDLGDATLLPGLIDAHVHLLFDGGTDPVGTLSGLNDDGALALARENARTSLLAGTTTVRDLGDRGFACLDLGSDPDAPCTVLAAGPPLTVRDGHLHYLGGVVETAEDARRTVRRWAERGVHVVKVVNSGGELTPGTDPFSVAMAPDVLRAIVDEAHEAALKVTAHAHGAASMAAALDAGVDGLEHGVFLTGEAPEIVDRLADRMAERGVTLCPTLGGLPGFVPPPRIAERLDRFLDVLATIHARGVTVVAGSDAGIAPPKPHGVMAHTVAHMAQAMGAAAALRSATSVAAEACGLEGKGRLAAGMDADILTVAGDPLADPSALLDVRAVFRAGVRVR